jgi:hypothetical protein
VPVRGVELGPTAVPVASHYLPVVFCSFFLLSLGVVVIYIFTYINIYVCIFIEILENLCLYTHVPPCPQLQRVEALGLRLDTRGLLGGGVLHRSS